MSDLIEREWQFEAADLEAVERWLIAPPDHAPFDFAFGEATLQEDVYLDTPVGGSTALASRSAAARVVARSRRP
jgi:hypothetical protein